MTKELQEIEKVWKKALPVWHDPYTKNAANAALSVSRLAGWEGDVCAAGCEMTRLDSTGFVFHQEDLDIYSNPKYQFAEKTLLFGQDGDAILKDVEAHVCPAAAVPAAAVPAAGGKCFLEDAMDKHGHVLKLTTDEMNKHGITRIAFVGDIHSAITSFAQIIEMLREKGIFKNCDNIEDDCDYVLHDNAMLFFTGDFGSRGPYGVEVIAWVMLLIYQNIDKGKTPHFSKVRIIKGNHETLWIMRQMGLVEEMEGIWKVPMGNALTQVLQARRAARVPQPAEPVCESLESPITHGPEAQRKKVVVYKCPDDHKNHVAVENAGTTMIQTLRKHCRLPILAESPDWALKKTPFQLEEGVVVESLVVNNCKFPILLPGENVEIREDGIVHPAKIDAGNCCRKTAQPGVYKITDYYKPDECCENMMGFVMLPLVFFPRVEKYMRGCYDTPRVATKQDWRWVNSHGNVQLRRAWDEETRRTWKEWKYKVPEELQWEAGTWSDCAIGSLIQSKREDGTEWRFQKISDVEIVEYNERNGKRKQKRLSGEELSRLDTKVRIFVVSLQLDENRMPILDTELPEKIQPKGCCIIRPYRCTWDCVLSDLLMENADKFR